ncbi:Rieske 2Fe-2S domain-containing protein [Immundisolibacter sp.]|uniref:aromatic ring-hydroxylating oxygenase subunit alpha n=1 Tax=Immundisolibacter sp. TaxID=1934948 RepID=UPI003569739A
MDMRVTETGHTALTDPGRYFIDEPQAFNVHRDLFRDQALFELEMAHVFEAGWVFLCHESQLPNPHDFYTTQLGRTPVVVLRGEDGALRGFVNACPHRGTRLYTARHGTAQVQMCPYHAWCFDSAGHCVKIKDQSQAGYAPGFDGERHDLTPLAHLTSYQGFVFGALRADVPALADYLGDTRFFIDTFAEQSAQGMEILPGEVTYVYRGNWKLQVENTMDIYHLTTVHSTFAKIVQQRGEREASAAGADKVKAVNLGALSGLQAGTYTFPHGHTVFWGSDPLRENRALWAMRDDLLTRGVDAHKVEWMFRPRVLNFFPNIQFVDSACMQLRVIRPLAVDRTEMTMFCLAPRGEPREGRRRRLRQYEDFFNASGIATPDDVACYEDIHAGGLAHANSEWIQGFSRGMQHVVDGPDSHAREIGIRPLESCSGVEVQDETVFRGFYREWRRRLEAATHD